jgi:hypothetical protein
MHEIGENYNHYILSHVKSKTHRDIINSLGQTHNAGEVISAVGHSSTARCKYKKTITVEKKEEKTGRG